MSVHAGAERNVCIIKVSAETPQSTTNQYQTLLPMCKLAHLPLSHLQDSHNLYRPLAGYGLPPPPPPGEFCRPYFS